MPHFKCVTCKTRLYNPGGRADCIDDVCPSCGSAFEPAGELAELVGFRAITSRDRPGTNQRLVERLGDLLDSRALQAQARLDAERWGDDGGSATAEAVALPRPETTC
jgi:hypothetical protein